MKDDERAWVLEMYEHAVADVSVRALAFQVAQASHSGEHELTLADLESARPYLRGCYLRMSPGEVISLTASMAASLWARGTVGAHAYRHRPIDGAQSPRRSSKKALQSRSRRVKSNGGDADP